MLPLYCCSAHALESVQWSIAQRCFQQICHNSKTDLREIEWNGVDWIGLSQDRDQWRALVNTVMKLWLPYNAGNFLSGCTSGSFSRRAELRKYASENSNILLST
jgi:hypothetical protein